VVPFLGGGPVTKSPWVLLVVGGLVPGAIVVAALRLLTPGYDSLLPWTAGGAALGLLSGFVTGASEEQGSGAEFLRFLSGAIVLPLLGALPTLLEGPERMTERYVYAGDQLAEKVVETRLIEATGYVAPLHIIGAFLVAYAIMAISGIVIGADARKADHIVIRYRQ
ncbi:MAG TPA: hypothetical protein VMM79_09860, partial [Longimicrobiales bacterium]|nr:hypothetical protein [Longimicrobiales bacterium]